MLRVVLIYILPLIAPAAVYLLWRFWQLRRNPPVAGELASVLRGLPVVPLGVAGVVLLLIVLAVAALTGGRPPHESYTPPRLENGRIVPGETEADPTAGRVPPP